MYVYHIIIYLNVSSYNATYIILKDDSHFQKDVFIFFEDQSYRKRGSVGKAERDLVIASHPS